MNQYVHPLAIASLLLGLASPSLVIAEELATDTANPAGGVVVEKAEEKLDRQGNRIADKTEQKVDQTTDSAVDKALDRLLGKVFGK